MGQRPHVLHDVMLDAEYRQEPIARVVNPVLHRHGPFQHRADAHVDAPGHGRLRVLGGRENLLHIGAGYLRDRHFADAREGVGFQAAQLDLRVTPTCASRPDSLPAHARRL